MSLCSGLVVLTMADSPEEIARKKQLLREIWSLEEDMLLHEEQLTPEEIVAIVKQVRKEMAEERQKYNESVALLTEGEQQ